MKNSGQLTVAGATYESNVAEYGGGVAAQVRRAWCELHARLAGPGRGYANAARMQHILRTLSQFLNQTA